MEHRLDRAEQKRQLQLQMKVRKAHEEETKVFLVFNFVAYWNG